MHELPLTGLILTGGGARAAYQVGVLRAIARIRRESDAPRNRNPFGVIVGTSAGAVNAAALACYADHFDAAVHTLHKVWSNFSAEQVYRTDSLGVIRSGANWLTMLSIGWLMARWRKARPKSLLDNEPLNELLDVVIRLDRLPRVLAKKQLHALAITASSYSSGQHVTFYQAAKRIEPWTRSQRLARQAEITREHLLASSAIPFVFPAKQLELDGSPEWFGDGSMRQSAPISPAVHLGAERVLIIGSGRMHEPPGRRVDAGGYPSLAQIAGHALSSIFLDSLAVDIERMTRINHTLSLLPEAARMATPLRPIDALVIAPSQRLDDLAAQHQGALPVPVRTLLRGVGVTGQGREARGAALASYLLFEKPYTRALIKLGEIDTEARREEVMRFFGWKKCEPPSDSDNLPLTDLATLSDS